MTRLKWILLALLGACGACFSQDTARLEGAEVANRLTAAVCDAWNRCEGRPVDDCLSDYERLTGEGLDGVEESAVAACEDAFATTACGDAEWHEWLYQTECDLWG